MRLHFEEILKFWFGHLNDQMPLEKNNPFVKRWFTKDDRFDAEIRRKFEGDIQKASQGDLHSWEEEASGRLALVILFDQFPRNMYRNSPQMFAYDAIALNLALRTIHKKIDQQLQLVERLFLYMPLQHCEDLEIQKLSLKQFEKLVLASEAQSPSNTSYYQYTLSYAKRHHDIIERFGRFPHRNALLNRPSTEAEMDFLKGPGSSF